MQAFKLCSTLIKSHCAFIHITFLNPATTVLKRSLCWHCSKIDFKVLRPSQVHSTLLPCISPVNPNLSPRILLVNGLVPAMAALLLRRPFSSIHSLLMIVFSDNHFSFSYSFFVTFLLPTSSSTMYTSSYHGQFIHVAPARDPQATNLGLWVRLSRHKCSHQIPAHCEPNLRTVERRQ